MALTTINVGKELAAAYRPILLAIFTLPDASGSGATGTVSVSSGAVTGVTITNGGSGYASNAKAAISGDGVGAQASLTIVGGVITGATVTAGGSGYTFAGVSIGGILRVSTHNADSAHGGYAYGGNDYLPRIDKQDISALASLSEQGVDRIPSVTLHLSDADGWLLQTYERGYGLLGAKLELRLVLHDVATGAYSSDSFAPFLGICDKPGSDEKTLVVSAVSKMNLTRVMLPNVPIQFTCPKLIRSRWRSASKLRIRLQNSIHAERRET